MKKDIDRFLDEEGLDALLILGSSENNPEMAYFSNGGHLTDAILTHRRGRPGILFCFSMERDEASKSGLQVQTYEPYTELLERAGGDTSRADVLHFQRVLERAEITSGRVAIGGRTSVGPIIKVIPELQHLMPGLTFLGEADDSVTRRAMATKDEGEIERIRSMGRTTVEVVEEVADFLSGHRVSGSILVKGDGSSLTIGEVKRKINLWLAERGAESPSGTIFAAGRDAALPHSSGQEDSPVPVGETIVFDIYPREVGGGYFYDFTRTWCLGYATDEALALYEDVRTVYREVVNELLPGSACAHYQERTCDLFEARGHSTIRNAPDSDEGYVHTLGHGLGLFVHELPRFGEKATEYDVLDPGVVFTIEPGLYYPDRAMGVRLEDTYYARPDGKFERLADYPMELVLPVG